MKRNFLNNLSAAQYKELLKLLPDMHKEKNKAVLMLIFTFLALAFLGIFAINPTLGTILDLQKQVKENEFVYKQLTTKMNALSNLQQQYTTLSNDLPFIYAAIPKNAEAALLVGQIQSIAEQTDVSIRTLRITEVPLAHGSPTDATALSFVLSLEAEGDYDELIQFASILTTFNRIVTIESIAITKNKARDTLVLHIQSRAYFKK